MTKQDLCDFAEEITAGCPISFCKADYDCRYLLQVPAFLQQRYCLKRLEELKQDGYDKDAIWVDAIEDEHR